MRATRVAPQPHTTHSPGLFSHRKTKNWIIFSEKLKICPEKLDRLLVVRDAPIEQNTKFKYVNYVLEGVGNHGVITNHT